MHDSRLIPDCCPGKPYDPRHRCDTAAAEGFNRDRLMTSRLLRRVVRTGLDTLTSATIAFSRGWGVFMSPIELSPAQLVRYDHVIRLTQYRHRDGAASPWETDQFITAWKQATAAVPGVVYRELCRQVPEWTALAAKEVDSPIEAGFLEYLVAEPDVDLDGVAALPPSQSHRYSIGGDLHTVAFRFAKDSAGAPSGALMFNLFEINGPAGMEQAFLMDWPARGEFKINEDAIRSTMLHQRMLTTATIKAFNRAEISSAAAYAE